MTANSPVRQRRVHVDGVLEAHLVVVAEHHEGRSRERAEPGGVDAWRVHMHPRHLLNDDGPVLAPVGRHLAVGVGHELRRFDAENAVVPALHRGGRGGEHEVGHQIGSRERDVQRDDRAVAVAEQVHGCATSSDSMKAMVSSAIAANVSSPASGVCPWARCSGVMSR